MISNLERAFLEYWKPYKLFDGSSAYELIVTNNTDVKMKLFWRNLKEDLGTAVRNDLRINMGPGLIKHIQPYEYKTNPEFGWIEIEPGETRDSKDGLKLILKPDERIAIKPMEGD